MIISQTPLRLSFLGGGSDLPAYYRRKGGAVLSTAIDKCVYVTVSRKFDDAVRVSYSRTEEVAEASRVEHPIVREALGLLGINGGIEITSVADIPAKGTGLGSSSSFSVGLLNALHAYVGRHASAERLAEEACDIEINRCGEPIGKQDQFAAAFGGFNFIRFHADESVEVQKLMCRPETLEELQSMLMMFYTGITRSASALLKEQSANMAGEDEKIATMDRMVASAESVLRDLQSNRLDTLGPALEESWQLKKSLASGITSPEIDGAHAAAISAGALGGKILGAGGGGFLLFLVPQEKQAAVREALRKLRETPFRFARHGSRIIFVH
ncbi:MAG: GHMP kinase [Chthoniobacterales bacterium]|nr:GHMP kinase [Chthoniobacterales bacterium]